jgi:hypothetical protein
MLLLHGQLNRASTARAGDVLGQTLSDLDAAIDPNGLTEEHLMTIVHGNRL